MRSSNWHQAFTQWQALADNLHKRANVYESSVRSRAFALAATVDLPPHGLCIYNASIDSSLTGWCHGRPDRLKVAKRVNYMLTEECWKVSRLVDGILTRAYERLRESERGLT